MLTNAHISCIYFLLIGLIVDEIRQEATLPSWPHYPSFPYINVWINIILLIVNPSVIAIVIILLTLLLIIKNKY